MEAAILVFLLLVGVAAAMYPISHSFEALSGENPPPELQERNSKRENWSMFIILVVGVIVIIILFPALVGN
ncbi:MAG TPA: hypothetical protein VFM18_03415 [Methanosarcina sp.]|nr:hypothetical protein [Methanosarcina sp.]